jgi:Dna[CI] antecedent, DciA
MRPLAQALPGALAELLRDVPLSTGKVNFAWRAAVGPGLERVTDVQLSGAVLLVDTLNQHWAREVTRSSHLILARLQTLLGKDTVTRIDIRLPRS